MMGADLSSMMKGDEWEMMMVQQLAKMRAKWSEMTRVIKWVDL